MLLLLGLVAIGKMVQLKRQGASLDQAITDCLIRVWEWVRKELEGFERLFVKVLYYFVILALFLAFILWGLWRL